MGRREALLPVVMDSEQEGHLEGVAQRPEPIPAAAVAQGMAADSMFLLSPTPTARKRSWPWSMTN